ncbi:MAG: VPEID-CTERM sorting domain-containing protein [Candidatus Binatus sp.]
MRTHRTKLLSWIGAAAVVFLIAFKGVAAAHENGMPSCAPELDPATGASGLALLIGSFLLALERRRSR